MVQIRQNLPLIGQEDQDFDSAQTAATLAQTNKLDAKIDINAWLLNMQTRTNLPLDMLKKACALVQDKDDNHKNLRSGAFATGVGMADILVYLLQDETALVAAMLYRSARHNLISIDDIAKNFSGEIAALVKDALAMGHLSENIEKNKRLEDYFNNSDRAHLSTIYSMLISTTNDVRAVLIKLAERTFAMRELSFASQDRQKRVAQEVMTIYAPLAHRLGIGELKWELEDLAFRYLEPTKYKQIASMLAEKRAGREAYILQAKQDFKQALLEAGIDAVVSGRVKHIYSIWRKMNLKNLSFNQLYDIRALRVLVKTKPECYHALGVAHGLWRHIPEQFDDYITNPKPNGYKSLHTAVIANKKTLEIQIRTFDMHFEAELGMCAHVNYKEGSKNKQDDYLSQKISSLRQLLAGDALPDDDNLDNEIDNRPRIYLFSPDGDIIELPKGATVLDFAYYVHTEVGNRAVGAKVNGKFVPLTHCPKTGEQVEIITKTHREPNRDWLIASLGYIKTSRAKSKLRQWFNKLDKDKNIETGKAMLNRELLRLSLQDTSIKQIMQNVGLQSSDDLYLALTQGELTLTQITAPLLEKLSAQIAKEENENLITKTQPLRVGKHKIALDGLDNTKIYLAGCCNPVHGETIAGFITQSSGVSIHKKNCAQYQKLIKDHPKRAIAASWVGDFGRYQPVDIYIECYDRRGILRDLTGVLDKEKVNICRAETISCDDSIARMKFSVEVANLSHLSRLLVRLEQQPDVIYARRFVH